MAGQRSSEPSRHSGSAWPAWGVAADVFVVGGAAMALAYDATRVTRDVDAVFKPHGIVLEEARKVADDLGLPYWWLNDQASVYISGKEDAEKTPAGAGCSIIPDCASRLPRRAVSRIWPVCRQRDLWDTTRARGCPERRVGGVGSGQLGIAGALSELRWSRPQVTPGCHFSSNMNTKKSWAVLERD